MRYVGAVSILAAALSLGCDEEKDEDTSSGGGGGEETGTDDSGRPDSGRPNQGPETFEEFVQQHAGGFCKGVEDCGDLADLSYADRQACIDDIKAKWNVKSCVTYDQAAANKCVQADKKIKDDCEGYRMQEPLVCQSVCPRPDSGGP
jgi:hypothetical protein